MWLQLGYDIDGKELDGLFARFKTIAGNKKVHEVLSWLPCSVFPKTLETTLQATLFVGS